MVKYMKARALADRIFEVLSRYNKPLGLSEIADKIKDKPISTIRGRIYDNLDKKFKRVAKGVYIAIDNGGCLVIEGNGRDLSMIEDNSIDSIITDHAWLDNKSNLGGNRKFANEYPCFRYNIEDFKEKARVLKEGAYLVEVLPAENENNFEYLYEIKKMAKECGLLYYSKVPWKKGSFVSNTGRKSKNTEDIMFFTKGKPRSLRHDVKKTKNTGTECFMSGTSKMLPTAFDFQPVHISNRINEAEKPIELFSAIIEQVTKPNEIILDQFSGSGAVGESILKTGRIGILFEIVHESIIKIANRLNAKIILES